MVPQLQPIPMALLERYPNDVDDDVLKMLKEDPALFEVGVPLCYTNSVHLVSPLILPGE
jgi:hypothetical protein